MTHPTECDDNVNGKESRKNGGGILQKRGRISEKMGEQNVRGFVIFKKFHTSMQ